MEDNNNRPLTRSYKETVIARIKCDPIFREMTLKGGVEFLFGDEPGVGKILLRDYINGTIGFDELGKLTGESPESLIRMFGPDGNPDNRSLPEVIRCLQRYAGIQPEVTGVR